MLILDTGLKCVYYFCMFLCIIYKRLFFFQVFAKETSTLKKFESERANVYINLTDVNDNNPKFNHSSYTFNVTENKSIGKVKYATTCQHFGFT